MYSQQITCMEGQCDDPSCGTEFVYVSRQRVPVDVVIKTIDTGASTYWALAGGECVPVVVGIDAATGRPVLTTQAKTSSR